MPRQTISLFSPAELALAQIEGLLSRQPLDLVFDDHHRGTIFAPDDSAVLENAIQWFSGLGGSALAKLIYLLRGGD